MIGVDKVEAGYWIAFEMILCLVEIIVYRIFISRFGQARYQQAAYEVICAVGASAVIYLKSIAGVPMIGDIFVSLLVLTAYSVMTTEMKTYQYVVFSALFLLLVVSIDFGITAIMQLILSMNVLETFKESKGSRFICSILSKMILLMLILLMIKKEKDKKEVLSAMSMGLLLGAVFISFVCIYSVICLEESSGFALTDQQDFYMCLIACGLFAIDVLLYVVIRQLNRKINEEKQMELIQYQNELLEKVVLENKEVEKEWRKKRHDFNNHLSCIDMLLQMENLPKARSYISDLTQNYMGGISSIRVGNEVADAVVNQKYVVAKNSHIDMSVEGSIDEPLPIEQMDLCALLSNSLDNAIEAAQQIEDEEGRYIHLRFKTFRKYLIIEVENAVKENIDNSPKRLKTTKKDKKHHGIGMASMLATVEKYKGHLEWNCKDHCFSLVLLLPRAKENPFA